MFFDNFNNMLKNRQLKN